MITFEKNEYRPLFSGYSKMFKSFPFSRQSEEADCGAACIKMVSNYYGREIPLAEIKRECPLDRNGTTLKGLSIAAESFGFRTNGVKLVYSGSEQEGGLLDVNLPCIAFWNSRHYVIIYKANKNNVWVADPAFGKKMYSRKEFEQGWVVDNGMGILLLLEPTPQFYQHEETTISKRNFFSFFSYLRGHQPLIIQLLLSLLIASIFSLILPLLTQMVVDKGIVNQDLDLVHVLLIAQLALFVGSTIISVYQGWIFLHIGVRINISLIHDFLLKLMKLPLSFFNRRVVGDLLQRIDDHHRINSFITSTSFLVIFSFLNVIIFSIVLLAYSYKLFMIFWIGSIAYLIWILAFLRKRKEIDHKSFELAAANQSKLLEIINGIQEIKLQNSDKKRRWQWVNLQGKIFRVNIQLLRLNQAQGSGASFINQLKNILISFFSATAVIKGDMSLGMMLAVQYIIGSINAPLESIIGFVQNGQEAKISFDRLNEIHQHDDEEINLNEKLSGIPLEGNIKIENLSFRYSNDQKHVLEDINIEIPWNKITAIVGNSGSGKTTLVKLLLCFYQPTQGRIKIGNYNLNNIRNDEWRSHCGAVLQDSFIFPDTIAHNICEGGAEINNKEMFSAAVAANADEFINSLQAGFNTTIGGHGINLSQGQLQRILIARSIYKNPNYLFFDEATNSLDTNNEKIIMGNLKKIYDGKTVIIVAHRMSTVSLADQIIVLDKGRIVESGKHEELLDLRGFYYKLVNNQSGFNG